MNVLLVGAGGYGKNYVRQLLFSKDPDVHLVGVVDPYVDASGVKDEILGAGIPIYDTMEAFYRNHAADLAILATPPFLHKEQSIAALRQGSYVLTEKPVAPTVEDAEEMRCAEEKYGRFIAVGYQWSYARAIQDLKRDVLNGVLGRPISMKTAISWPRNFAYYGRGGGWGGRISKGGVMIFDSIASNACAHYLHNMLFLLGDTMNESAFVDMVIGECYRANEIESFDTCTLKMTAKGVPLYFCASHAAEKARNPEFVYEFEKATVVFAQNEDSLVRAIFRDGREKCYGNPFSENFKKIWDCADAIRAGEKPICTVKTAMAHTALIGCIHREIPIRNFPREQISMNVKQDGICVKGLYEKMYHAYDKMLLLSEVVES